MENLKKSGFTLRRDPDDPGTIYVLDPDEFAVQLEPSDYRA